MPNISMPKEFKIALILRTDGLDYDDRVRKEILSIKKLFDYVSFYIYVVTSANKLEEGISSYGTPYKQLNIKSLDTTPNSRFSLLNAWELYLQVRKELKQYDAIWIADQQPFLIGLFLKNKPIIWDLHELPLAFTRNFLLSFLFRRIERKCNAVIHANEARKQFIIENNLATNPHKHYVLHNFTQFDEVDSTYDDTYTNFIQWLGDQKCIYLQGVDMERRAPMESISSILKFPDLRIVVVGYFDEKIKDALYSKYGNVIDSRIFFTGRIKQIKTPQYIQKCILSLVFYKNTNPNNYYCEPNRLFQCIINNKPVVVGNNPPMKDLIDRYEFGVCVNTDGSDEALIVEGINKVLGNYQFYLDNIKKNKDRLLWDSQENVIKEFVETIL